MPSFITIREAARLARISPRTMQRWASRYGLGRRVGGQWRIDPTALNAFLQGQRTSGPSEEAATW